MSTKEKLLLILEQNRHRDVSGEELASTLGVTRAAIWKTVGSLERDGHRFDAAPNRGYRLLSHVFSAQAVEALLPGGLAAVRYYQMLDSTNNKAKELAAQGCPHGTVVIANEQNGGRGRFERCFSSPSGGLYMTVVIKETDVTCLTAAAAVAVCRAVESVTGQTPCIKWVNDVLLDGKKLCGILSEAAVSLETKGVDWAVVGMGVNMVSESIPEELRSVAAALFDQDPGDAARARLAAEIVQNLLTMPLSGSAMLTEYRRRLSTLGRAVTVRAPNEQYEAVAEDIDEEYRLIVRLPDGAKKILYSGEISVKTS
ncbi:MAG: biotin--[acetyl-CoA-carboxylase] ligase [Oscillospiraceae bacterium]|nr:biotin--[acetyl-CoA-carboxylase] ligase [Oscillospiraceae bacterium]